MRVIYNGIDLCVLETHLFECEAVYDDTGTDYLYTKVLISIRAVVNGQIDIVTGKAPNGPFLSYQWDQSAISNPVGGAIPRNPSPVSSTIKEGVGIDVASATTPLRPVFRVSNAPALTHQVVRHRLSTPQGTLFIFSGPGSEAGSPRDIAAPGGSIAAATVMPGAPRNITSPAAGSIGGTANSTRPFTVGGTPDASSIIIQSPITGKLTDCKNGPSPRILSLVSALGDANTFIVDWTCETYINEGPVNSVNPSGALLSNRFSQTHIVDKDGFTTIRVQGIAIYRTDLVYGFLHNPDFDRYPLFMPIPQGFVREDILVEGLPDVTGIRYTYQDRQVPVNFPAGPFVGAAEIVVMHRQGITSNVDLVGGMLGGIESFTSFRANRSISKDASHPKPADTWADWAKKHK